MGFQKLPAEHPGLQRALEIVRIAFPDRFNDCEAALSGQTREIILVENKQMPRRLQRELDTRKTMEQKGAACWHANQDSPARRQQPPQFEQRRLGIVKMFKHMIQGDDIE